MSYLKLFFRRRKWPCTSFIIFVTFISLSFALHPYTQKGDRGKGKIGAEKFPTSYHANYSTYIKQRVNITGCPTDTSTTFAGRIDYIFQHLDKSQVPTGMLQEYGIDFLPPENFTGSNLNDSNYINIDEWRMLYANLYSYQINTTANLDSLGSINSALQPYTNPDTTDALAVMFYYYNSFTPDAITSNLVKDSCDQLYDVAGRTQSPYQTDTLFAMAPVRQSLYTGSNNFIINTNLFYTNTGKAISSVYITTDSTAYTWQSEPLNAPFSLTFDNTGLQDLGVKIVFTDGTQMIAHSKVDIYTNPNGSEEESLKENQGKGKVIPLYGNSPGYPDGEFLYYDWQLIAGKAYLGQKDTGLVTVQLSVHNTSGHIKKPLIFIEGFDPTTGPGHNTNYYLTRLFPNISYNQDNNPPSPITLNTLLDSADDYDAIYISFNNGMDYIERNAYLVETLIQQVNAWKAQYGVTTQNVVVGESMGAVIARYALRDMELNSINHQTRLFISHDGPQYGANVPVGYQLMVQHLTQLSYFFGGTPINPNSSINNASLFPEVLNALNIFNSPAAKELLVQRYVLQNPSGDMQNYTIQADNTNYTNFQNELNGMGYPQDCRNIAISDGACNGTQQFIGGTQLVNGGNTSENGINYFVALAIAFIGNVNFPSELVRSPIIQIPIALVSSTRLITKLNVYAINTTPSLVYQGEVNMKRKILGLISVNNYITKYDISSIPGMLPLDNAPGGVYNIDRFIDVDSIKKNIPDEFKRFFQFAVTTPIFCFVPTVSSLAIQNPWPHLDESICDSLGCLSVFDDYYAPTSNLLHISYTQPMSDWIQQRQDSSFSCIKICSDNLQVTGDNDLCSSSVYSLSGAPVGSVISWTATPSGIVSLAPNGDQVTVTETGNGTVTLQATISNACTADNNYAERSITVGVPVAADITVGDASGTGSMQDIPAYYNGQPYYISNSEYYFDFQSLDGHTIYGQPPNHLPSNPPYEAKGAEMLVDVSSGNPNSIYFSVSAHNTCGSSGVEYFTVPLNQQYDYVINPNPASGTITIAPELANKQYSKIGEAGNNGFIQEVKIYTSSSKLAKQQQFSGNASQVQMDVSSLSPGVYFVEISNGQHTETQKLVIGK